MGRLSLPEEHGREYYYQPATSTSLWRNNDTYTTSKPQTLLARSIDDVQRRPLDDFFKQDDDKDDIEALYNVKYSFMDEFLVTPPLHSNKKKKKLWKRIRRYQETRLDRYDCIDCLLCGTTSSPRTTSTRYVTWVLVEVSSSGQQ